MGEVPKISDEAIRVAAEAIEDRALLRLGRDLGTVHRDEIVHAGLCAAYPLLRKQWEADWRKENGALSSFVAGLIAGEIIRDAGNSDAHDHCVEICRRTADRLSRPNGTEVRDA